MRKAFTAIELVLTIGIIAILSLIALANLSGRQSKTDIDNTAKQMASVLREAQSKSLSQVNGTSWGVHFENSTASTPFYALFSGAAYATTAVVSYYRLSSQIAYATATLASGAAKDFTFLQVSGLASSTGLIGVYLKSSPNTSSTVTVGTSGAVSF